MEQMVFPKHFIDLFVDRHTHEISHRIFFRKQPTGWKKIWRAPFRAAVRKYPHMDGFKPIVLFAPYVVELEAETETDTPFFSDKSERLIALYDWLDTRSTAPWFFVLGPDTFIVHFTTAHDAVMCRLCIKSIFERGVDDA